MKRSGDIKSVNLNPSHAFKRIRDRFKASDSPPDNIDISGPTDPHVTLRSSGL